jgi:hypothetical protein
VSDARNSRRREAAGHDPRLAELERRKPPRERRFVPHKMRQRRTGLNLVAAIESRPE